MADNVEITPGSGDVVGADDISGVKYQRVKLIIGSNGINDGDVASANPLPISGTVSANLGATDNAVLDAIAASEVSIDSKITACNTGAVVLAAGSAAIGKLAANSGVDIGDVDVASCALPTGASTAANQATIIGHVDGLETSLSAINEKMVTGTDIGDVTINNASGASAVNIQDGGNAITVDNGGTFAVQADITKIAGASVVVSGGSEANALRVTLANDSTGQVKLAAGTAAIGKLTANSGVDIGDVDVLSIAAGDNNIGNVDIASAIPAGNNNIGDIDIASIANASLNGPGVPVIDSYTQAAINLAAGNDQVLVSSAANKQIWVYGITFTVNVAGTVSFQDEDNTAITGIMNIDAKGGMAINPSGNFAMPIWKLATDKDLEVDVVTAELDGFLTYAIVSV
jgi:hypothetical protein